MALTVPSADSFGGLPDVRQRSDRPAASFLNPGETLALESASQAATALNNAAIQLAKQEREKNIALQAKAGANDLDVFDQDQAFGNTKKFKCCQIKYGIRAFQHELFSLFLAQTS